MIAINSLFQNLKHSHRLQEQHSHDRRCHIADHKGVHSPALEGVAAGFHFLADPGGLDDPAYEDAGKQGDKWH